MITKEDEEIIKGLHKKGYGDWAIAQRMGVAARDVELVLKEVRRQEAKDEASKP